jgi:ABC-type transport system substrate-binding protein
MAARSLIGLLLAAAILAACTPTPTPLPVVAPPTHTPIGTAAPQGIRYLFDPLTWGYFRDELPPAAQVTLLESIPESQTAPLSEHDVVLTVYELAGTQRTDYALSWALILNAALPPLDDPSVREIVRAALDPSRAADALRIELANAGYPDGVTLFAANATPADVQDERLRFIAERLSPLGIDLTIVALSSTAAFESGNQQLIAAVWSSETTRAAWVERFGGANIIELARQPLYYAAAPGIEVTFAPDGFPTARRS